MRKIRLFLVLLAGLVSVGGAYAISFTYPLNNLNLEIEVISVPDATASIASFSFISGQNHDTINIPDKVSYNDKEFALINIKSDAFKKLSAKVVKLPSSVTSIGNNAFYESTVSEVVLPSSLKSIGSYAFYKTGITSITLPSGLNKIDAQAFASCEKLRRITIPKSVTLLGSKPFLDTPIESFEVESGNEHIKFKDGVVYCDYSIVQFMPNTITSGTVELLEGLKTISSMAFSGAYIRTIKFPSSLKTIGEKAFYGSYLSKIEIPNTVETIEENAFNNCLSVKELIIEDGTTMLKVKKNSFDLYNFYFVDGRGGGTWYYVPDKLEKLYVGRQLPGDACLAADNLTEVVIGGGVTQIFRNLLWRYPTSTNSHDYFHYMTKLKSVTIGENVEYIENGTFDNLVEVEPDSAISSFERFIVAPENQHFASINGMLYSKDSSELIKAPYIIETLNIPKTTTKIDQFAFKNCSIGTAVLPEDMTVMPDSLFFNTNKINVLFIPEGVANVSKRALEGAKISKLVLPSSLKQVMIGSINVTGELYCNAEVPPRFESNSFNDEMYKNTTLYVPVGTKAQYSKAKYWCNFFKIVETETGRVNDVEVDDVDAVAEYYNLQGLKVAEPRTGEIVIVRRGGKVSKEVYRQ